MKIILAPSLLSADLANAASVCQNLEKTGISWLHLDVMDGNFVPNITFGPAFISSLRKNSRLFFDVHLMIDHPEDFIEVFTQAGADLLVIHVETTRHPQLVLENIRKLGRYAGLALNPGTDFHTCRWLLPYVDMILVMGVNPGFSGQKFIPETLAKLKSLRIFLEEEGYPMLPVEMDGGAAPGNAATLAKAGANILVSGSAFFGSGNYEGAKSQFAAAVEPISDPKMEKITTALEKWKPHF